MVVDEHSFSARYGRFIARYSGVILGVTALIFLGSLFLASKLELRTAFSELLPSHDPGVVALRKTESRMGDMSLLLVGVHSPDREANLRYAEAITQKLSALPKEMLAFATYHVRDLRDFFEANRLLYLPERDLTEIRDRLRSEIAKRKNPLLLDLSDDADESVEEMKQRYAKRDLLGGRFPNGVFSNQDGSYVWIAALPPGGLFGERAGEKIYEYAKQLIVDLDPRSFHPQMTAHVGGPVATLVATRHTVEQDILWVTIICVVVIAISLFVYFRRWRSIPLIGIPGVLGTVMAFAVAELAFGYVNSSTAFLGSIILGNGINYAIILISRYEELRAEGESSEQALAGALRSVVRGTIVATTCASAAYATLMLTSFRGFYQFGLMSAFGVLFCWLATFIVLPAVLYRLDYRTATHVSKVCPPLQFIFLRPLFNHHSGLVVLTSLLLTLASLYGLTHFLSAPFEYDFRKLAARVAVTDEVKAYNQNLDSLFGRWPSPTIILADDVSEVESIRQAIDRQDKQGGQEIVGQVLTIYDILPGTPEVQARRLELIAQIRKLVRDPNLEELDPKERETLKALDPKGELRILTPQDLPFLVRRPFTEADGTVGRVVLFYPKEHGLSVWNGRDLLRIAEVVQTLHLEKEKKTIQTSGGAVVFAAMIRSVLHDGPIATVASLLAVILVIIVAMRPWRSAIAGVTTMLLGVIWMVGVAGLFGVQITFLNFIALPITFGIGAEYSLNLAARYRQEADIIKATVTTGGAVVMCSWTTMVGYGSLLAARNRALQGFGSMAILGEIFCLASAILALPAIILWRERRRQHSLKNRA